MNGKTRAMAGIARSGRVRWFRLTRSDAGLQLNGRKASVEK